MLSLLVHDADILWRTSVGAAAMSLEALRGTPAPLDPRIHENRPHPGQIEAAALMRQLLEESEIRESHRENDDRVQDAYSLRCSPQVFGAVLDAIRFVEGVARIELNASTDNPLVFESGEVVSGGNFHGQPVAQALDFLAIALTTLQAIAERRVERLVNPDLSQGLPAFLTENPGLSSGYMMVQITAASLVAESRCIAMPASIGSIPTDANQEDFVPMGMAAAFKASRILRNAARGDRRGTALRSPGARVPEAAQARAGRSSPFRQGEVARWRDSPARRGPAPGPRPGMPGVEGASGGACAFLSSLSASAS